MTRIPPSRNRLLLTIMGSVLAILVTEGCSRTSEQKYATALAKGKKLLESNDPARAALEFQNAAKARPKEAEAYYLQAQAYVRSDQIRDAISALRKASDVNPNYAPAQVKLAELMIMTHNEQFAKDAEARLMAVLTADPSDADALYTLAATEAQLGNAQDAEKHLSRILEGAPRNLRSAVALAQLKGSQGDFAAAERVLRTAIELLPGSPDALVALGVLYEWMGKPADATLNFQKALKLDPKNSSALVALGPLQAQSGDVAGAENTFKQVAALPNKEHRLAYAIFLMQQKRPAESITELERLVKADRSDRLARTSLVAGYLIMKRTGDAESLLNAVLKKNPRDIDALVQRGEIYLRNGRYAEAQHDLNEVLHSSPSAQAHYLMASVYRERGALTLQKQELFEAMRLAPGSLRVRVELANALTLSHDPRAALETLDGTPEKEKRKAGYVLARNWALMANGDPGARKAVEAALGAARVPETLLQDAVMKLSARNIPGARDDLEQVLKADPEDLRALSTLVQMYMWQKQPAAALERIRQCLVSRPNSAKLKIFMGTWLLQNNREAEGRQALAAAKTLAPSNPAPDLLSAGWDVQTGKLDAARAKLTALVATYPGNIDAHMMLGDIEDTAENHAAAVAHYRKVLELDGNNVRALNNLAYNVSQDAGGLDEGMKYAQRAKELAPQIPQIQATLGWIYYRKGLYPMAARELEAAHATQPTPSNKFHLGLVYKQIGKSDEGRRLIAAALAVDPTLADKDNLQ